jgi:hypothetical protein
MHRLAGDPACEPEAIDSGGRAVQDKFPGPPATLHAFIVPRGGIEMPHAFAYSPSFKELGHLRNAGTWNTVQSLTLQQLTDRKRLLAKMEVKQMSTKYFTNLSIALLGGFVVVATQVFAITTAAWLALALGIAVVAISLASQVDRSRGVAQRGLDLLLIALGAVTIVFSRVFTGSAVMWLSFAEALGFVGLAVAGLTVHEVEEWRAEHQLPALSLFESRRAATAKRAEAPRASVAA